MEIKLYTDEEIINITQWVIDLNITRSVLEPYETARLNLKIPESLQSFILPTYETGAFSLDTWIIIFDKINGVETAQFMGVVNNYTHGYEPDEAGMVETRRISLSCESWLHLLRQGQIFLSSNSPNINHIYDIDTFWRRFKELSAVPFKTNNIGEVIERFYLEIAKNYRFPKTLSTLDLSFCPIVYSNEIAEDITPSRKGLFRGVFGIAFHAVASFINKGTAYSLIRDNFQPDNNLIELFTSLEPLNGDPPANDLEQVLQARPVLIYRFKPFAFGIEAQEIDGVLIPPPSETAIELPSSIIYSVDLSQNEADRINGVFISTPLTPSRTIELFGLAGEPYIDNTDINRAGLRFYSSNWSFFPQGKKTKAESYQVEIQKIIDLSALVIKNRHHYFNGTIKIYQRLEIKAGEWVKVIFESNDLYCYVDSVSHTTIAQNNGVLIRYSIIEFSRGYYA